MFCFLCFCVFFVFFVCFFGECVFTSLGQLSSLRQPLSRAPAWRWWWVGWSIVLLVLLVLLVLESVDAPGVYALALARLGVVCEITGPDKVLVCAVDAVGADGDGECDGGVAGGSAGESSGRGLGPGPGLRDFGGTAGSGGEGGELGIELAGAGGGGDAGAGGDDDAGTGGCGG